MMKQIFTLAALLLTMGCMKKKVDSQIPFLDVTGKTPSSIRIFNFNNGAPDGTQGIDVSVNNVPLTNYHTVGTSGNSGTVLGLSIFPAGEWISNENGSPFTIPTSLLDKDGKAHIVITSARTKIDTVLTDDVAHPKDYYLLTDGSMKVLDRDNLPPTQNGYFKIRIINMGDQFGSQVGLDLGGPVSLTYSDGSEVNALLNNVARGAASPYIELPYGSYQFKLFISNGGTIDVEKQMAEFPQSPYFDPCNTALKTQQGMTPRVRTYKAGGVYTILVGYNFLDDFINCDYQSHGTYFNGYRVLTEQDPGVNYTFAIMQAVNALPGKKVSIQVDGKALGGTLDYIGAAETTKALIPPTDIFVQGNHKITLVDDANKILAQKSIRLYPADHYTLWAYEQPDGTPALIFEANEMTGWLYSSVFIPITGQEMPDDGTNGTPRREQYKYAWESRFLNLCPDQPYITFTNDYQLFVPEIGGKGDTMRYHEAYVNLPSGLQPQGNVSLFYDTQFSSPTVSNATNFNFSLFPKLIRAYQSRPGTAPQVPGAVLPDIAPLNTTQTFIANDHLYTMEQFHVPETGVYTVALVGRTATNASPAEKARIIAIKHNK